MIKIVNFLEPTIFLTFYVLSNIFILCAPGSQDSWFQQAEFIIRRLYGRYGDFCEPAWLSGIRRDNL